MISREAYDRLAAEVAEYQAKLGDKDRRARGGTTLGEAVASGAFAEGMARLLSDPRYIREEVARRLDHLMGDPRETYLGEVKYGGMFGNQLMLGINSDVYERQEFTMGIIGTLAAHHYGRQKARNRLASLRELEAAAGELAAKFEERLEESRKIRRIQ